MDKNRLFDLRKNKQNSINKSIENIEPFYSSLKNKLSNKFVTFSDDLKDYILKTKNNEDYLIALNVYNENNLSTIYICNNVIQYLNSFFEEQYNINKNNIFIDILFEKDQNENLIDFLKRVENEAFLRNPTNFYQNYGEFYYKIKYKSNNSLKIQIRDKENNKSKEKDDRKLSNISNKSVIKFIKVSKALSNRAESEFDEGLDNIWFYDDFIQINKEENEENLNSISENSIKNENNSSANKKDIIKEEKDIEYEKMFEDVNNNFLEVVYTSKNEKEISEWVSKKQKSNLAFFTEYGGNSY